MTTPENTIKETRRAAMVVGAMADMLSSEIDLELLSSFDRRELGNIWHTLHVLNTSLENSAYAMEEKNLNTQTK
jgi:hypothetical protein